MPKCKFVYDKSNGNVKDNRDTQNLFPHVSKVSPIHGFSESCATCKTGSTDCGAFSQRVVESTMIASLDQRSAIGFRYLRLLQYMQTVLVGSVAPRLLAQDNPEHIEHRTISVTSCAKRSHVTWHDADTRLTAPGYSYRNRYLHVQNSTSWETLLANRGRSVELSHVSNYYRVTSNTTSTTTTALTVTVSGA